MTEQKWRIVPLDATPEMYGEIDDAFAYCNGDIDAMWKAGVNAAPKPEPLSDERILHHLDAILKASGSGVKNYSMHKTIEEMKQAVRAIERDILGETEK